jgi:hypothetical protein
MKSQIYQLTLALCFLVSALSKVKRNILVQIFPGAKSHSFVMKELFDYSKSKTADDHQYYILVHKSDEYLWKDPYKVISFGDVEVFHEYFTKALIQVQEDPVFGYTKFSSAMIYIYESFLASKAMDDLRKIKFDVIMGDIPNYLFYFLKHELNIPLSMFLSPPCTPSLFYGDFEWNASYLPSIGTPFTEEMTFLERFQNAVFVNGLKTMFGIFMTFHVKPFNKAGYNYLTSDLFDHDTFIMQQCPTGIAPNFPRPPNYVVYSAVTPRDAKPLENKEIDEFLNIYEKNIYLSQGTIMNVIKLKELIELFNHFPKYGFILSFKGHHHENIQFPKNVLVVSWVDQNDLLGDKRLHTFISHGGINSIMEALYHLKPVIALGLALDQINTASYVKQHGFGVAFLDKHRVTVEALIQAIEDVLKPGNKYMENTIKYQKILKANKNPREDFHYWLEYGFEYGFKHLQVKAYKNLYNFQVYNYDLALLWLAIFYFFYRIVKKVLTVIFCSCKVKKDRKEAKDDKEKKD